MFTNLSDNKYLFTLVFISLIYYLSIVDKIYNLNIGDLGRDLYASQQVFKGYIYLRDFDYPYGFAMPYMVSFIYHFLGVSIKSFNITWMILQIFAIVFTFKIARLALSPLYSFVGALCMVLPYHGFPPIIPNHIGGQLFGIISLYFLLKYLLSEKQYFYLIISAVFCGMVSGVKLNMGLATFASNIFIILLFDRSRFFYYAARYSFIFLVAGLLPYMMFFIFSGDYNKIIRFFSIWKATGTQKPFYHLIDYFQGIIEYGISITLIKNLIMNNLNSLLLISLVLSIIILLKYKIEKKEKIIVASLIIFSIFKSHEYIVSHTYYSLTVWFFAPAIILPFWILSKINLKYPVFSKLILAAIFVFNITYCIGSYRSISSLCKYYLPLERGRVFLATESDTKIVTDTIDYIKKGIKAGEPIQSLSFSSMIEYLLDSREVFWGSFNGTGTPEVLKFLATDSLIRLEKEKPKYLVMIDYGKVNYLIRYKEIMDYVNSEYAAEIEFKANPDEHGQIRGILIYKYKSLIT